MEYQALIYNLHIWEANENNGLQIKQYVDD